MASILDLDLRLAAAEVAYAVEVQASPAGQCPPVTMFGDPLAILRPEESAPEAELRGCGLALWRCAFGSRPIGKLWRANLAATRRGDGLRLRLIVGAPG